MNSHSKIKNLVDQIEQIKKESSARIKYIHKRIKEEAKNLTYREAYYLLQSVSFSREEFCLFMNEIKDDLIED